MGGGGGGVVVVVGGGYKIRSRWQKERPQECEVWTHRFMSDGLYLCSVLLIPWFPITASSAFYRIVGNFSRGGGWKGGRSRRLWALTDSCAPFRALFRFSMDCARIPTHRWSGDCKVNMGLPLTPPPPPPYYHHVIMSDCLRISFGGPGNASFAWVCCRWSFGVADMLKLVFYPRANGI